MYRKYQLKTARGYAEVIPYLKKHTPQQNIIKILCVDTENSHR